MNQIDLKGRVAVVTGGAQGIGYATSQRLLQSGAKVVIWDIDDAKMAEACQSLAPLGAVSGHRVELTDDADVAAGHPGHDRRPGSHRHRWSTTPASPAATA
jgi:3-oxoacyl-[acyl-carrier protein] reductase